MTAPAPLDKIHLNPTVRLIAYIDLVRRLWNEITQDHNLAPIIIACIRGLRLFPEYRDTTVLLLEEIEVTGHSHFDQLMKREMDQLTTYLLELAND